MMWCDFGPFLAPHFAVRFSQNHNCRELIRNSQSCEKQNRENIRQRKIIKWTRQYLRDLTICLRPRSCKDFTIIREKYKVLQYSFSHSKKRQQPTLIIETTFSTSCAQDSQWATKRVKIWACRPKPPLQGLSLKKSPIKNHATLFRVGSSSKSNTTRLHKAQQ